MLWHSDMVGILLESLRVVHVEQNSQLNIHSLVQRVTFLPYVITKYEIWLLVYLQKSAMKLRLSQLCNQLLAGSLSLHLQTLMMVLIYVDIAANGFWGGWCEKVYVDVKVFNPHAPSNCSNNSKAVYKRHEMSKKRSYEARIH